MTTTTAAPRGLPAAKHDDDTLLDGVALVARQAEAQAVGTALAVSQLTFNRLRTDVDRGLGIKCTTPVARSSAGRGPNVR